MTSRITRHLLPPGAILALGLLLGTLTAATAAAVTIPTVPVGNAGNAADPSTGNLYGSVGYEYRIGTTEVTNAQYAEFLNLKAASDPLGLYNPNMGSNARGGITRSGSDGSYTYAPKMNMGDKPVNYVTWYDAIRFANWLNNGQGTGDTETGAYTLLGGTATPSNGMSITRNTGATWFLTSEDEWYKAAYHQPAAQGGDSDDYWTNPMASNSEPSRATANSVGDISNPGENVANYSSGADWNSLNGNVTTVGSAGPLSESYYGTSDQGGNVGEWNEALISGLERGMRGGGFSGGEGALWSSTRNDFHPEDQDSSIGFRVATVPEPGTAVLAIVGGVLLFWCSKRPRRVSRGAVVVLSLAGLAACAARAEAVTIPTVPVGNAGNAGEVQSQGTFGAVAYDYRIGTTEVTVGQYTEFLNAVAATDTYALYNSLMTTNLNTAGISRTGAPGSYTYSVIGSASKPVTYVSWGDAARFSNWLHNGQPSGAQGASTTEDGAYTLNGATSNAALNAVSRNPGAVWFLPSENEWYKAAYHKNDGATGNYWNYPTSTDSVPYSDQPPGSDAPTQSNTGNFYSDDGIVNGYDDGLAVTGSTTYSGSQNYLTDAGAYTFATSPYGTYDQGGNVSEWNESLTNAASRGLRGGSWSVAANQLPSSYRTGNLAASEVGNIGFRVVTVPEPGTAVLGIVGCVLMLCWRMRRTSPGYSVAGPRFTSPKHKAARVRLCSQLAAIVLAGLAVPSANAATISLNYTALITTAETLDDVSGIPNILAGITAGVTEISGSVVYDTAQAGTQASNETGDFGIYAADLFLVTLPSMAFHLPGRAFDISVRDNVNFGVGVNDQFLVQTASDRDAFGHRQSASLSLHNASPGVFDSTALPTSLNLADFPIRRFSFVYNELDHNSQFVGAFSLEGTITSLELVEVPEPSTMALSAGLLAVLCWRRRSSRARRRRSAA